MNPDPVYNEEGTLVEVSARPLTSVMDISTACVTSVVYIKPAGLSVGTFSVHGFTSDTICLDDSPMTWLWTNKALKGRFVTNCKETADALEIVKKRAGVEWIKEIVLVSLEQKPF